MRIVFDSNVLISAAVTAGLQANYALQLVIEGKLTSWTSAAILQEVEDKLRTKFGYVEAEITKFSHFIRDKSRLVIPATVSASTLRDPDDLVILGTAIAAEANLLITTDRDLLTLGQYERIGIVHPKTLQWLFPKR